jgi:hypothetical protein
VSDIRVRVEPQVIRHQVTVGVAPSGVAAAIAAHVAAADPHTGYQLESEKGQANGYASLGSGGLIPTAQLASGTATSGYVPTADGAGGVAWASASGGLSQVANSPLMTDGEAYVWPGHGEVTPPTLGDWTAASSAYREDATLATGSLTSSGGGLLLQSGTAGKYYGAYKAPGVGVSSFTIGLLPAHWVQADLPVIALALEAAHATLGAGRTYALEWAGSAAGTGGRIRCSTWITGTFANNYVDVEVPVPPAFGRIYDDGAGNLRWEVSWGTKDGPWRPLYRLPVSHTVARVWVVARPGNELDALTEARGVDVPWLHYEEG